MNNILQFLIAFGVVCGIAAWFLYQKTLSKFILHVQMDHRDLWQNLGSPDINSPPIRSIMNPDLRQYIWQKKYASNVDTFVVNMGNLLRQRLLFCLFCLICVAVGLVLLLVVNVIA